MKEVKGSVQVKNGVFYTVIPYKDEEGKYKYKWESTGLKERGNKKEANRILEERLQELDEKEKLKKEKLKRRFQPKQEDLDKANWLFTKYLKNYVEEHKDKLSEPVYHNYSTTYIKICKEYFDEDKLRLIDVGVDEIKGFYSYLKVERGVKDVTIKHYSNVLRPALKEAFQKGIIPDNPYDFMPTIGREKYNHVFYDKSELELLLDKLQGHRYELAYKMLAFYGFRRSELLGLRWQAIDFEHNTITVNHKVLKIGKEVLLDNKLKTQASNRTLPLVPAIRYDLLEHKKLIEENKAFYGDAYNQKYMDYIFVNDEGRILYPDHISDTFKKFLRKNNLKYIRLHDLRHSCASLLLANGVPMKQIQDWLGHANFNTTADTYSHLDFSSKVKSADIIHNALVIGEIAPPLIEAKQPESTKDALLSAYQEMQKCGFTSLDEYFEYLQNPNSELPIVYETENIYEDSDIQITKSKGFEM